MTDAGGKSAEDKKLGVIEVFGPTFQGEGPLCGAKTMFIRFAGCDYRCAKCDSLHAVMPEAIKQHVRRFTAQELCDEIVRLGADTGTHWVTLSGGNPCMWDLDYLISLLNGAGYGCALETQGTLAPKWIRRCQMVVVSPKSPGMGEKFEPDKFVNFLKTVQSGKAPIPLAIKVVVFSQQDFEFALEVERLAKEMAPGTLPEGMMFISLGNHNPPVLQHTHGGGEGAQIDLVSEVNDQEHVIALLQSYRALMEDFVRDPRIKHWRFLPQMHVLTYSNEAER